MPAPRITGLDHLVLTVASLDDACAFYADVLGMDVEVFRGGDGTARHALRFGDQKINLHLVGGDVVPKAARPTPGSGDLCLLTDVPLEDWAAHFEARGVTVELGPVPRTGARGPLNSLYLRDPDRNLIEIAHYLPE